MEELIEGHETWSRLYGKTLDERLVRNDYVDQYTVISFSYM